MHKLQQIVLNNYLNSLSGSQQENINAITVEHFCNTQKDSDEMAQLVLEEKKTATCSMKYWYDQYNDNIQPQVGNIMLVTNFVDTPVCITQTISVQIKRFCDVDQDFAFQEGEGDRTLSYWQKVHWQFFSKECQQEGI